LTRFNDLGLAEPILQAVTAAGYTTPTPIQQDVIPAMISGKDIIGIAQTGTGKTASFVLPILNRIAAHNKRPQPKTCGTLILAPTRELASQIADNIKIYSKHMRVSAAVIVGGVKPGPQIKACARGLDIIIATPGRLLDHLNSGAVRLDHTFQVIADEADHMMDMGFLPSIRKIMQALPKKRQTVLLSATMPGQIRNLAKDFMTNPVEISVTPVSKPIERITQIIKRVEKAEKKRTLVNILSESDIGQTVVFTRTKHGANKVTDYLVKAGLSALAIHGNKSQSQREKSLASFKAGSTKVLVATDIAARGIDIDDVSHVVNFELPNVPESYVHRIGRTARAGRSGVAISLCDMSEIKLLRDIEKLTGQNLLKGETQSGGDGESRQPANNRGGNKQQKRSRKHKRTNGQQQQAAPAQHRNKRATNDTDGNNAGRNNSSQKNTGHKNNGRKNTKAPGADKPTDGLRRVLGGMPSNTKRRAA